MKQTELRRDTGVVFENTASVRQTESHARRDEAGPPGQREHPRDAGVSFGKTESTAPTATRARREEGAQQSARDRDAGVSFESLETERPQEARRDEAPPVAQAERERSHDAGVVFENVKSSEEPKHPAGQDGGILDLLVSMAELGGAATRFTLHQMRNAAHMVTDPFHAAGHLQHSIDEFSAVLNKSLEEPASAGDRQNV